MSVRDRFKDAMTTSLALAERGEHVDALKPRMKRLRKRFENTVFCGYAPCVTMQLSSPDLRKIGHQLSAITSHLSPRTPKMPELCTEWRQ